MKAKTLLITGAAGSLGAALAEQCVEAGYNTVLLDSDRRGLDELFDRIVQENKPQPALFPMDLSVAGTEDFEALTEAVEKEFGGLDGLVHCAARFEGLVPLEHVTPPEWLHHMQVNLNSAWLLSVSCLPLLRESDSGHLYFLLEDLPKLEGAFWGPYGVSKHALRALALQLAAELKSSRVQVLGIDPGPISSPLRSKAYHSEHPQAQPPAAVAAEEIVNLLGSSSVSGEALIKLTRA